MENLLEKLLFFDIETAGLYPTLEESPLEFQEAWKLTGKDYSEVALYAEFSQIVCCSFGYAKKALINGEPNIILNITTKIHINDIHKLFENSQSFIPCGWNIKGFDIQFLNKHFIKAGLPIPKILKTYNKKPWEVNIMDLQEIWKNLGQMTSKFNSACVFLGIESPKDDISGADVHKVFHAEGNERIIKYCEKDVIASYEFYKRIVNYL